VSFNTKEYSTSKPLKIVHTNIYGPIRIKKLHGEIYFMFLIDDYTKMTWVRFLKNKFEAFDKFKSFKALVENERDLKIK